MPDRSELAPILPYLVAPLQGCKSRSSEKKEDIMRCVEYERMRIEESTSEKQGEAEGLKPFVVPSIRVRPDDQVARRVAEVLDFELAQGSMPT